MAVMAMTLLSLRSLRLRLGCRLLLGLRGGRRGRLGASCRLIGRRFLIGCRLRHLLLLPLLEQQRLTGYRSEEHTSELQLP